MDADGDSSPHLALAGFDGPLAHLLELARAHRVDLEAISLRDLVEQLTGFLLGSAPLFRKADGLVMAAWLVQLRAGLLAPLEGRPPKQAADAAALRERLLTLRDVQALAAWLDRRPALGRDVFVRGRGPVGIAIAEASEPDMIAFLWASLTLFDADLPAADTAARYRPPMPALHTMADAVSRLRRLVAGVSEGQTLERLVPLPTANDPPVRRRSAWSSTFMASLELARQGEAILTQESAFGPVYVSSVAAGECAIRI